MGPGAWGFVADVAPSWRSAMVGLDESAAALVNETLRGALADGRHASRDQCRGAAEGWQSG